MSKQAKTPAPLIGRSGVVLVASDILAGVLALPAAAFLREYVIPSGLPLAAPEQQVNELGRLALWVSAALSGVLWPIALRAVDPGYPSALLPMRRVLIAAVTWLLSVSGTIYLLDKSLESRALVVLATIFILVISLLARQRTHGAARGADPEGEPPEFVDLLFRSGEWKSAWDYILTEKGGGR